MAPETIVCPQCQKAYRLKPEWAGRTLKCKCGGVIEVPRAEDDAGYELDLPPEELEPTPPPKPVLRPAPPPVAPPAVAADAHPLGKPAPVRPGSASGAGSSSADSARRVGSDRQGNPAAAAAFSSDLSAKDALNSPKAKRQREEMRQRLVEDAQRTQSRVEYLLPGILLLVGLPLGTLLNWVATQDFMEGLIFSAVLIGYEAVVAYPIMLISLFVTAWLLGITFGSLWTALWKILGLCLGPAYVADALILLIGSYIPGMGFLQLPLMLFLYLVLMGPFLSLLFNLDMQEVYMTIGVMIFVRIVSLYAFIFFVLTLFAI